VVDEISSSSAGQQLVQLAAGQLADELVTNRPAAEQQDSGRRHDAETDHQSGRFVRAGFRNRCEAAAARRRVRQQRQQSLAGGAAVGAERQQHRQLGFHDTLGKRMVRDFDHGVGVPACGDD